jgi:hypothetical protein
MLARFEKRQAVKDVARRANTYLKTLFKYLPGGVGKKPTKKNLFHSYFDMLWYRIILQFLSKQSPTAQD